MGNCPRDHGPGGELSLWGIVLGIMVLVGNSSKTIRCTCILSFLIIAQRIFKIHVGVQIKDGLV